MLHLVVLLFRRLLLDVLSVMSCHNYWAPGIIGLSGEKTDSHGWGNFGRKSVYLMDKQFGISVSSQFSVSFQLQ